MNHIDAIIFDLDGVICSTDRYHYLAWKTLADRLGIPFDKQVNRQLRGVSRMESLEIVLGEHSADYSEEQKLALANEKNEIYKSYLSSMTPGDLSKEVRMTLHTLRQRGYLLAIGSSSSWRIMGCMLWPCWSCTASPLILLICKKPSTGQSRW